MDEHDIVMAWFARVCGWGQVGSFFITCSLMSYVWLTRFGENMIRGTSRTGQLARLHRDGLLGESAEHEARALLDVLRLSWFQVQPGDAVREQALRLFRVHPLRAADALQLAAALEWAGAPPQGDFVTYDDRLRAAAVREGFRA